MDRKSMKSKWVGNGLSIYIGLSICVLRPPDRDSDTLLLDKGILFASIRDVMACVTQVFGLTQCHQCYLPSRLIWEPYHAAKYL